MPSPTSASPWRNALAPGCVDSPFAQDSTATIDNHRLTAGDAARAVREDNADGSGVTVASERRDRNGRSVRAQLHEKVGRVGAVIIRREPDGIRGRNPGNRQEFRGTHDDLIALRPGLEDVARTAVGCGRADAEALALADGVVPIAFVMAEYLSVGSDDLTLSGAKADSDRGRSS